VKSITIPEAMETVRQLPEMSLIILQMTQSVRELNQHAGEEENEAIMGAIRKLNILKTISDTVKEFKKAISNAGLDQDETLKLLIQHIEQLPTKKNEATSTAAASMQKNKLLTLLRNQQ
jgi:Sec-independent protein translocase protein TatA